MKRGGTARDAARLSTRTTTAESKLAKAASFLDQAERAGADDLDGFVNNLEAAIIFGKSVRDMLMTQHGVGWLKESVLWNDPLCVFFADLRNIVIHEDASIHPYKVISLTHRGSLVLQNAASITDGPFEVVVRADGRVVLVKHVSGITTIVGSWNCPEGEDRATLSSDTRCVETVHLFSDAARFSDTALIYLVRDYLNQLRRAVDGVEPRASGEPPSLNG